jgi:hypothetical protein
VRRRRLMDRTLVRAGTVAMAVLLIPLAGSSLLLGGTAGAATPSAPQMGPFDPAAPPVSYWTGTTKYPGGGYEFNFTEHGSRLTYFFVGGACTPTIASESSNNFPASVPVVHGKFALNFTTHRARSDRTIPGYHVTIEGQINIKAGAARGTLRILDDPSLGGACDGLTGHWIAHNDTMTTD